MQFIYQFYIISINGIAKYTLYIYKCRKHKNKQIKHIKKVTPVQLISTGLYEFTTGSKSV